MCVKHLLKCWRSSELKHVLGEPFYCRAAHLSLSKFSSLVFFYRRFLYSVREPLTCHSTPSLPICGEGFPPAWPSLPFPPFPRVCFSCGCELSACVRQGTRALMYISTHGPPPRSPVKEVGTDVLLLHSCVVM